MSEQITQTAYSPPPELADALQQSGQYIGVETGDERDYALAGSIDAIQREVTIHDDETEVTGTETMSGIGTLVSVQGDLGLASVYVLSLALTLGEPTLLYTDERLTVGDLDERYHDLSAEWYRPVAVEADLPKKRMELHEQNYDHEEISLDRVESFATAYLGVDEQE